MNKFFPIGVSIAWATVGALALAGCSQSANPLEGTWQGTLKITGAISAEPLATADQSQEAAATEIATLTLEFLPGQRLKLATEPAAQASPYPASDRTSGYEVVEELPDQFRLRLTENAAEENPRELQLRFTGPDSLTLTETQGNPRLLPVAMKRIDER